MNLYLFDYLAISYKKFILLLCLMGTVLPGVMLAQTSSKKGNWETLQLKYDQPADVKDFGAGLPIGNGRLGAKIFGTVASEEIYVNETTLWSGKPRSYNDAKGPSVLAQVRAALAGDNYRKADSLVRQMEGNNNESYQPLGSITLDFDRSTDYTNYSRMLDLDRALVTVRYRVRDVNYTRELFASYPDQVIVMRIYGDRHGSVNFNADMDTQLQGKNSTDGNTLVVRGRAPVHIDNYNKKKEIIWDAREGMTFESRLNVKIIGGRISLKDECFNVAGADTAVLIFSSATSFNGFDKEPGTQGKKSRTIGEKLYGPSSK